MSSFFSAAAGWLQRKTGWSNSSESWNERLGLLAWFVGVAMLWQFGGYLSEPLQVIAVAALAGLLAYILRRGWLRLLGPVFFYDAVRLARQQRQRWLRLGYAGVLSLLLAGMYGAWYFDLPTDHLVSLKETARLAASYFETFIIIQAITIALMTPAYVAGAITDEKERKTLEFLMATDLRSREIIFGKLSARIGTLTLFILAGLPVLSLIQFFGGVDPEQLIAGFAATLGLMLSLSAVSIFASVVSRKSRDAIALAYLIPFAYFALTLLAQILRESPDMIVPVRFLGWTFTGMDILYALTCGNPLIGLVELERTRFFGAGTPPGGLMYQLLGHFLLFHLIAIVVCLTFAVVRMRPIALRQSYGGVTRTQRRAAKQRPQIGDEPMIWKEVFVEGSMNWSTTGKFVIGILVALSFVPPFIIAWHSFIDRSPWHAGGAWYSPQVWEQFSEAMQGWVRAAGCVVACLLLLAIAIRGAVSVRGEQERQTLESLLTTSMSSRRILWGKWWGCVLGVRAGWMWLGLLWIVGLSVGAIHFGALPGLVLAMAAYASAFAWIGIWFSLVCRSTLRASLTAIITSLLAGGGYMLVIGFCCIMPFSMLARGGGRDLYALMTFLASLSPAVVMAWLPFRTFDDREMRMFDNHSFVVFAVFGVLVWLGASLMLSNMSLMKFREQANRAPDRGIRRGR